MNTIARESPASLTQRQFWLAQQVNPASAAYHIASAFIVRGALDTDVFERCVRDLAARHDIFRSAYEVQDGILTQRVMAEPDIDVSRHELNASDEDEFAEATCRVFGQETARPFDLAARPPIRLVFVEASSEALREVRGVCLIIHHIAMDLRTKDLIAEELRDRYSALLRGTPYQQERSTPQYEAFSAWQHEWVASERAQSSIRFWRELLEGRTHALPVLTDFRRPELPSLQGRSIRFALDRERTRRLRKFGADRQIDPYVLLLAAYYGTLFRFTHCRDFLVGVPLTNRRDARFQDVMGCFVNTLPLAVDLDEQDSFEDLVRAVRKAMLLAHRHQEAPIEAIVNGLSSRGDGSRNPLYQVGFSFEHPMRLELPGLAVEPMAVDVGGAQLELFLRCWHTTDGIAGQLEYDSALFHECTAERFLSSLLTMLDHALEEPSSRIDALRFVPEADERQIRQWNQTHRPYELLPLMAAFERQASKTPEARALSFEGGEMTYREFDLRANQVARWLIDRGVRVGDMVPICVPRGFDMLLGIYAILKAGAAYVPIEPDYPRQRVASILEDTGRARILTVMEFAPMLTGLADDVLALDSPSVGIDRFGSKRLGIEAGLDALAYVIFTSGSTGKPKGVMNTHGGIANRLAWMQDQFGLDSGDRVLAKTPFSFDVSVWEMFWPLQVGASIHIAPREAHRDPAALSALLSEARISTVHFVPSMLEVFLSRDWGPSPGSLQRVICSGEALNKDLQARFFERFPGVELHNLYGPTEAAVDVTHWQCREDDLPFVPIGRAIANTQIYVLDTNLRPTGIGVPGEICIGGIQVARGYVGNEALTRDRFVSDPFSRAGFKMYRTGDLGRFMPDGCIQYLGRMDQQVKIRGNRVELGEIESALRSHPSVREAAVVVRSTGARSATPELVAYVVGEGGSPDQLRNHLAESLPGYMIPAFFCFIDALPYTKSGKLDAKSLPAVEATRQADPPLAPSTETERHLLEIWRGVLGTREIGIRDNFFDVGGNSLLLTRVFGSLREEMAPDLRLASLFQYTTIERLARFLDAGLSTDADRPVEAARARAERTRSAFGQARRS